MIEYTLVGQIINTHGIKGGIRVYPYTFDINRFYQYGRVYIGEDKLEVIIKDTSIHKGLAILYFEGYDNINDVLDFKESYVYIRRDQEAILDEGTYYINDLIGCQVYDLQDKYIGELTDVIKGIANDVYEVSNGEDTYSIPAVSVFVKNIDIDNKEIIVELIDGMLDED